MFNSKKIALDKTLYDRIAKVAAQAGYASVQAFVVHILEQQVRHLEDAKDEEAIRKRLEGLGYID
ncbi:MAG TPA: hypothetical protein VN812_19905 [Candidatus Acidoferrales bacterium]|nr:hypothetical protein [Candidatus Acidoferrales bacterium]